MLSKTEIKNNPIIPENFKNKTSIKNSINSINSKEEDEQETYDESRSKNISTNETSDKKLIELIPGEKQLNEVKNRLLFLSPTVELGFERESNKYDFINEDNRPIGRGGYGEVWKVKHEISKRIFCIKIVDKKEIFEQKMVNQINKEISIMYNINHPYSIKLYNHFEDNEKLYLVMELATNGNLYDLISKNEKNKEQNKQIDINLIKKIIIQTIEMIKYLHSINIIYRDIKPENILLDKNFNVKLCDYGWATYITPGENLRTFCGTPEYVAPELLKKLPYNQKVDIWGIGVLIFELVNGFAPFSSNFNEDRFNNIKNSNINWPEKIDNDVKDLIEKILKVDPNERLTLDEIEKHKWLCDVYKKMKEEKLTNDTMNLENISQTELYKNNIMNPVKNEKKIGMGKIDKFFDIENDNSFDIKEILKIYKVENRQLKLKILKVEDDNKQLMKKCSDYNDLCYLNEKLNKKNEENKKMITFLNSKCLQRENLIQENENKLKEITNLKQKLEELKDIQQKYNILENEYLSFKNLYNSKNENENENNIENLVNNFKIEIQKLIIFKQTNNDLIKNSIEKIFNEHIIELKSLFEEKSFKNSKTFQTIDFLNNKMKELHGYKGKAEKFQGQVELLQTQQNILKEQIDVYRKIIEQTQKIKNIQKENMEKMEFDMKKIMNAVKNLKKYIKKHFSSDVQKEITKILSNGY